MMDGKADNTTERAFPMEGCNVWDDQTRMFHQQSGQRGMTLRDYFAGQALQATIPEFWGCEDGNTADHSASAAYQIADAMLKAREQKLETGESKQ